MTIRLGQIPRAECRWRRSLVASVTQEEAVTLVFLHLRRVADQIGHNKCCTPRDWYAVQFR